MNLHSKDINQAKTSTSAVKKPAVAEIAHTVQGNSDVTVGLKAIGALRSVRPRWTAPTIKTENEKPLRLDGYTYYQ
jgi:hypothetical protein